MEHIDLFLLQKKKARVSSSEKKRPSLGDIVPVDWTFLISAIVIPQESTTERDVTGNAIAAI